VIDRLVFAHRGSPDFGPVTGSLPAQQWNIWNQRVGRFLRPGSDERPSTSIRYWTDADRNAAILRRIRGSGNTRTDRCHVLIGTTDTLTHRIALCSQHWLGWDDQYWSPRHEGPAGLDRVKPADIAMMARSPAARTGNPNRTITSEHLIAGVQGLLTRPERPLSLVTSELNTDRRVEYLHAIFDVVEHLLGERTLDFAWTFSTFEDPDDGEDLEPRIAFQSAEPSGVSVYEPVRRVVSMHGAQLPADQYRSAAGELVARYADDGGPALHAWLSDNQILRPTAVDDRVEQLLHVLQTNGHNRQSGAQVPHRRSTTTSQFGQQQGEFWQDHKRLLEHLDGVQLLCRLNDDTADARPVLVEIRHRGEAIDHQRDEVRRLLLTYPHWTDRVFEFASGIDAERAVDTLVGFAITPGDLNRENVAGEIVWALAQRPTGAALDYGLARHATRHGALGIMLLGPPYRMAVQYGYPIPNLQARPQPSWRPSAVEQPLRAAPMDQPAASTQSSGPNPRSGTPQRQRSGQPDQHRQQQDGHGHGSGHPPRRRDGVKFQAPTGSFRRIPIEIRVIGLVGLFVMITLIIAIIVRS